MSEIWADKSSKFVLAGPFDDTMPDYYIIINNYVWWAANEKEIYAWMKQCLPNGIEHHKGMVVTLNHEHDVTNFLLKWQ